MKNNILISFVLIFIMSTCRMPSDPEEPSDSMVEISIVKRLETINTVGECLDIDVDIEDSILVAAANFYGYFVYKINSTGGIVSDISEQYHIGSDEMDNSLGDNRAQSVILSENHNIAFVMDQYDHIWLYKYEEGATQYSTPNHLDEDCYGGTWISVAIDDQPSRIGVYTLVKHNAAEFMPYCIHEDNATSVATDQGCSDIQAYIANDFFTQVLCDEAGEEYDWMYPGCPVGNYAEYSTSMVWKNLEDPSSTSLDGEPDCEYIKNQGAIAEKIYFDNGLLSMAYGELGVRVFKNTEELQCTLDNGEPQDLLESDLCDVHIDLQGGGIDYQSCCEKKPCPDTPILENCENIETYVLEEGYPGFDGSFSSAGGIIPHIYAEFDTPGEVEAVFSVDNTIFAGLKYSNGCVMAVLDDNGSIISTRQFAIGYTIRGIHQDGDLLALAASHDGILLYNWNGSDVAFIGKLETSKAYNVKVAGKVIFAATEDGIEVIQIDYTL